jgi:hypothetical protein
MSANNEKIPKMKLKKKIKLIKNEKGDCIAKKRKNTRAP